MPSLGEWEKHTKEIGTKLLLKMGYQPGKGLGRDLQGRSLPVEAQVRKGRGAVGMIELLFIIYIIINLLDRKCITV